MDESEVVVEHLERLEQNINDVHHSKIGKVAVSLVNQASKLVKGQATVKIY